MRQNIASCLDGNAGPSDFVDGLVRLCAYAARFHDPRKLQWLRYSLVTVLPFVISAKLAGEDQGSGIIEWGRLRQAGLESGIGGKPTRNPKAKSPGKE